MVTVKDTDTESISGDYLDLGDVHTYEDEEFHQCVDEDDIDNEYIDAQDFQDHELPPLAPRDRKAKKFPPRLVNYIPNNLCTHPWIGFNKGRKTTWLQCLQEVKYFCE